MRNIQHPISRYLPIIGDVIPFGGFYIHFKRFLDNRCQIQFSIERQSVIQWFFTNLQLTRRAVIIPHINNKVHCLSLIILFHQSTGRQYDTIHFLSPIGSLRNRYSIRKIISIFIFSKCAYYSPFNCRTTISGSERNRIRYITENDTIKYSIEIICRFHCNIDPHSKSVKSQFQYGKFRSITQPDSFSTGQDSYIFKFLYHWNYLFRREILRRISNPIQISIFLNTVQGIHNILM